MPAMCLSLLFVLLAVPLSSASGGSVVIDVSTFSLTDFEAVENPSYDLQFEVTEFSSVSADVVIHIKLLSLEGIELQSSSTNYTIDADASVPIFHTFSALPYGYSVVSVQLTGDVGSSNQSFVNSINRTIHHLRPVEISLSEAEDVLLSGVDSSGQLTGNSSIHDGDYVRTEVAVINDGDYSWSGTISSNLTSGDASDSQVSEVVTVGPSSSTMVTIHSAIWVQEGTASLHLELNNSGDGDFTDEVRSFEFTVNPPPLPVIQTDVQMLTESYSAGDLLEWNASVANEGSLNFSGFFVCSFESQVFMNQSIDVAEQSTETVLFQTTARPGLLQCMIEGERIDASSISSYSKLLNVESAAFESAGSSVPAVLNGPWHSGDSAVFSMLVRNHGQHLGHVTLVCEANGVTFTSPSLELEVDAAGEVAVSVPMTNAGSQVVNWSLHSPDGAIDVGLNGSLSVPVAVQQSLNPLVTSVTWDAEVGISFNWSVELSDGIDRIVRLRLGYTDASFETYPLDYYFLLSPGITTGQYVVGLVDATRVSIRVNPDNWTAGFGFSSHSLSVPDERPEYDLEFSAIPTPLRPIYTELATVTVQIRNTGDVAGIEGFIVLSTQEGALLGEKQTESLAANSDQSLSFTFAWPEGSTVYLKATWIVDDQSKTDLASFQSEVRVVEDETSSIPWTGIFGGIGLAVAIGAVIRILQNRSSVSSPKNPTSKDARTASKSIPSSVEKIQVGCPVCARQLRVPADYDGSVRCPDCSNKFDVTSRIETPQDHEDLEDDSDDEHDDGKVELSCPKCAQSLRVPASYSGSVRCPACEEVFSSTG